MTVAPLPRPSIERLVATTARPRAAPTKRDLKGRRGTVVWSKRLLPVFALLLLGSVAMWPQIAQLFDPTRISYHRGGLVADLQAGKLLNVRYHGIDAHNRPFTVTSEEAAQAGLGRINLVQPKGDVVSENGSWTYTESLHGVYIERAGQLDMSGDVVLYRDSGVVLRTQSVAMDMKGGAASGNQTTHAEGPFGTLDAQGFALVDKGDVIQFDGRSKLVLNGTHQ